MKQNVDFIGSREMCYKKLDKNYCWKAGVMSVPLAIGQISPELFFLLYKCLAMATDRAMVGDGCFRSWLMATL
jgi:hypothetical protein